MYRIAKQSLYLQLREQLFHTRPLLVLQRPVSQINVILPDRIRFFYPDAEGNPEQQEVDVHTLGENAHGVCFLTGVCQRAIRYGDKQLKSQAGMYTDIDIDCCAEAGSEIDYKTGIRIGTEINAEVDTKSSIGTSTRVDPVATEAFRLDLIAGAVVRLENGERMTAQDWERRVRRRYAMDCKTDALPLSTMLITVKSGIVATSD